MYEINPYHDRPGEAVITDGRGVELLTLPAPFGRQVLVQFETLCQHPGMGLAADMLLHGIVVHRDIMASVQAREVEQAASPHRPMAVVPAMRVVEVAPTAKVHELRPKAAEAENPKGKVNPRKGRPRIDWTAEEDATLIAGRERGETVPEIVERLPGRTVAAAHFRIRTLRARGAAEASAAEEPEPEPEPEPSPMLFERDRLAGEWAERLKGVRFSDNRAEAERPFRGKHWPIPSEYGGGVSDIYGAPPVDGGLSA